MDLQNPRIQIMDGITILSDHFSFSALVSLVFQVLKLISLFFSSNSTQYLLIKKKQKKTGNFYNFIFLKTIIITYLNINESNNNFGKYL